MQPGRSSANARELCASCLHYAFMQPPDRIERGQDRPLLPGRQCGGVLTCENDAIIHLAEIAIVLTPRLFGPVTAASKGERDAMPGHRDAVLEFASILRMYDRPQLY